MSKPRQLFNGRKEYKFAVVGYILGAAALTIVLVAAISMTGAAATAEFANDTAELTDDNDTIEVELHWFDEANDTEHATIYFYNATEYEGDGSDEAVLERAEDADPGNVTLSEFDSSHEALELDTEYRIIVEGDDEHLEDAHITLNTGDADGGAIFASDTQRNGVIVLALIGGAYLLTRDGNGNGNGGQ
ncbi:hypothetical protein [Natronosalvus vescus]|uniref:hypothetical protein n=1 Tax=Natronosalvus vescus TaxID=2953881 RepID=UPI002090EED4|nr:hypothetical protein [Natronosalvus vescus]